LSYELPACECGHIAQNLDELICPSQDATPGYDTLPSFMRKHDPEATKLMDDHLNGFADEERMLSDIAASFGLMIPLVAAAPFYRAHGVTQQKAFQVGMLAMLWRV